MFGLEFILGFSIGITVGVMMTAVLSRWYNYQREIDREQMRDYMQNSIDDFMESMLNKFDGNITIDNCKKVEIANSEDAHIEGEFSHQENGRPESEGREPAEV